MDDAVATLAARNPTLIGFKDGVGNIEQMTRTYAHVGDRLIYIGGLPTAETFALPLLQLGVSTYSSALFNFAPQFAIEFYDAVRARTATEVYRRLNEFVIPYLDIRDRTPGYAVSIVKAGLTAIGRPAGPGAAAAVRPSATTRSPSWATSSPASPDRPTAIHEPSCPLDHRRHRGDDPDVGCGHRPPREAFATYRNTTPGRARRLPRRASRTRSRRTGTASRRPRSPRADCPEGRITGELGRTTGQLRMFAERRTPRRPPRRARSTRPSPTATRCRAPTSGSARCRSARSPCSAPATSRSRSRPRAATPPPRSPPAARWSSRRTRRIRGPASWSRAPSRAP